MSRRHTSILGASLALLIALTAILPASVVAQGRITDSDVEHLWQLLTYVDTDGVTIVMDVTDLAGPNDLYRRNPSLNRRPNRNQRPGPSTATSCSVDPRSPKCGTCQPSRRPRRRHVRPDSRT